MIRTDRKADRELLLRLAEALQVAKSNIHRDPCGDWNLAGRRGHVSTDGTSLYLHLSFETKRRWESAKRMLGEPVSQDGDDEGVIKLLDLPAGEKVIQIRKLLGLRKVAPLTDGQRSTLSRFHFARDKSPHSDGLSEVAADPGPTTASFVLCDEMDCWPSDEGQQ